MHSDEQGQWIMESSNLRSCGDSEPPRYRLRPFRGVDLIFADELHDEQLRGRIQKAFILTGRANSDEIAFTDLCSMSNVHPRVRAQQVLHQARKYSVGSTCLLMPLGMCCK